MTVLENDIAAFDRMRAELEAKHYKQWVVFHHGRLIDAFSEFEDAAATAVDRFDTEAPISSARLALRQPCSFRAAWSSRTGDARPWRWGDWISCHPVSLPT